MIFNAYQDTDRGIGGISVISCGHIFAQKGRKIDRPNGRSDYLLFYIAKGKEHFYLQSEVVAKEGSFVHCQAHYLLNIGFLALAFGIYGVGVGTIEAAEITAL